jgi:hypothetical protein
MTWRTFVTEANERTIWTIKKYMANTPAPTYIPTLNDTATSNDQKTTALQEALFPPPPPADLSDITDATSEYPDAVYCPSTVTLQQVENAVMKLAPDKAPGPDEITNRVLKANFKSIQLHLRALAQASFNACHFPTAFKNTITVVLRKPCKPDYTKPKAYRPIALENTLGKVLESIMADLFSYIIETHGLLPPHHYGGRPGRTAEDALMMLSESIHAAWRNGDILSAIFMDVAGAFNNVIHKRLRDNMRKRKIPIWMIEWAMNFLEKRTTQLRFNGNTSDEIPIQAGTPQGSPLSPIIYMLYNADLLDIPKQRELSLGFIDDITYGVQGLTDKGNAEKLAEMLEEAETWRRKHGAQFEKSKYLLVHFHRNNNRVKDTSPITMADITIKPSSEARYLGVILDQKLRFHSHLQYITKKGTKFALAMSAVAKSTWGAEFKYVRQLFTAVVVPRTDYAASIWHRPGDGKANAKAQAGKLETVQRYAMKAILGTFRTASTSALEIETALTPPDLRLQSRILRTVTRMRTLSKSHPLTRLINKAHEESLITSKLRYISNLEHLAQNFPAYHVSTIETIETHVRPP